MTPAFLCPSQLVPGLWDFRGCSVALSRNFALPCSVITPLQTGSCTDCSHSSACHVLAVQFFVLPRTVSRHVPPSIDVSIFETFAKKRCKETRTTGHATSRRRRVALPLVQKLQGQLWATRNIVLCCSPSRAEDGDSAQRAAVSKVLECQAGKRGREEPKPKSRNRRRLTARSKAKALQHWRLMLGHRRRTQQRMCSIFHCLAKRTLQASCSSVRMAHSSDTTWDKRLLNLLATAHVLWSHGRRTFGRMCSLEDGRQPQVTKGYGTDTDGVDRLSCSIHILRSMPVCSCVCCM